MFEVNHKEHINMINIFKYRKYQINVVNRFKVMKKTTDYCGEQIGS